MSDKVERRVVALQNIEVRDNEDGTGMHFSGYASVFNTPAKIGNFRETVAPGAFDAAIDEGDDVRMLFNHDSNQILGRVGRNVTLSVDDTGLRVEADLPNTTLGRDMAELVRSGIVTQMSFGFSIPVGGDEWRKGEDGVAERTLVNLRLFDVSPVVYPAYDSTTAEVRSHALEIRDGVVAWNEEDGFSDLQSDIQELLPSSQDEADAYPYGYVVDVSLDLSKALVRWYDGEDCDTFVVPITVDAAGTPSIADQSQWISVELQYVQADDADSVEADSVEAGSAEANSLKLALAQYEARVGKVLSADNMNKLSAAQKHIQDVMESASQSDQTTGYNSLKRKIAILEVSAA